MIVQLLTPEDLPELFDLYRRVVSFPPRDRVEEYWRWKFSKNPYGGNVPPFWVVRQQGRLVGALGQIPVLLDIGGRTVPAAWAVDFMVERGHQGQGIGKHIFNHYRQANDVAISMGYAPTSPTSRIARSVGFQAFPPFPFLFRLFTTRPLTRALPLGRLFGFPIDRISKMVMRRFNRVRPRSTIRVEEIPRFSQEFDRLWSRVSGEAGVAVRRNHAAMNWRYVDNPFHHYRVLGAWEGGDLRGCLVLKVILHPVFNYGTIAELIAPAAAVDVQESLLARAIDRFEESGVDIVKVLASAPHLQALFRRAGFRGHGEGSDFVIAIASGVDPALAGTARDPRAWYLTKGDCDLDMVPDFMSKLSPTAP